MSSTTVMKTKMKAAERAGASVQMIDLPEAVGAGQPGVNGRGRN